MMLPERDPDEIMVALDVIADRLARIEATLARVGPLLDFLEDPPPMLAAMMGGAR
jgi:hypothetical protein